MKRRFQRIFAFALAVVVTLSGNVIASATEPESGAVTAETTQDIIEGTKDYILKELRR